MGIHIAHLLIIVTSLTTDPLESLLKPHHHAILLGLVFSSEHLSLPMILHIYWLIVSITRIPSKQNYVYLSTVYLALRIASDKDWNSIKIFEQINEHLSQ